MKHIICRPSGGVDGVVAGTAAGAHFRRLRLGFQPLHFEGSLVRQGVVGKGEAQCGSLVRLGRSYFKVRNVSCSWEPGALISQHQLRPRLTSNSGHLRVSPRPQSLPASHLGLPSPGPYSSLTSAVICFRDRLLWVTVVVGIPATASPPGPGTLSVL